MSLPNPTEIKPWGGYQNLFQGPDYLVKIMEVAPGHRLSLQRHFKREEFWIIISGAGLFELDGVMRNIRTGDLVRVRVGDTHRVSNNGTEPILILEVQKGAEISETDIERLEDDYKRA